MAPSPTAAPASLSPPDVPPAEPNPQETSLSLRLPSPSGSDPSFRIKTLPRDHAKCAQPLSESLLRLQVPHRTEKTEKQHGTHTRTHTHTRHI